MNILSEEVTAGLHLVKIEGALTSAEAPVLIEKFKELAEQGVRRVVISLEEVPFIDSRGLAALITGYRMFGSAAHDFRLVGLQDQSKLVFELTGFDRIIQVYESVAEAIDQAQAVPMSSPAPA